VLIFEYVVLALIVLVGALVAVLAPPFPTFHLNPGDAHSQPLRRLPPVRVDLPGPYPADPPL